MCDKETYRPGDIVELPEGIKELIKDLMAVMGGARKAIDEAGKNSSHANKKLFRMLWETFPALRDYEITVRETDLMTDEYELRVLYKMGTPKDVE